jgi:tetratricopeptide (TPR) repeat protein
MSERAPRKRGSAGAGRSRGTARRSAPRRLVPALLAIAALAFAIRLVYLAGAAQSPLSLHPALDGRVNDQEAWSLLQGAPPDSAARPYFRPPGYAHFLAAVYAVAGHDLRAPRVAQALLGGLSVLLLGLLATTLWEPRVGIVAALLGALFGPAIYFEGELVSASLELFLALLSLWLLVEAEKRRSGAWCAAAGAAVALAAVTRPTIFPIAAIAAVWLLWRRVPAKVVVLFAVAALSLPVACTIRNAAVAGDPVFIASQGGINFYIGNHARADGTTPYVPGLGSGVTATYDVPMREASRLAGRMLKASEVSAFWFSKGLEFWRDDPGAALALFAKKVAMVWNRRELPNTQDQAFFAPYHSWLFRGPWLLGFAFLAPIALLAAWFERKRGAILILYAAALTAVTAAFFVCDRFRLPLLAFVAPLAAAGLVRAWDGWKASRARPADAAGGATRRIAIAGTLLVAAAAFVWLPFPRWQRVEEGMSWFRLATAYEQAHDDRQAARAYLLAEKAGLAAPEFYNNYGLVALREGDLATAGDRFRRAVALDPSYGAALANLAEVYMQQGAWGEAAAAYSAAAGAVPERAADFLTNAGVIYQRMGRIEAARVAFVRALAARPDFELAAEALRSLGPDPDEVSHRDAAAAKAAAEKADSTTRSR